MKSKPLTPYSHGLSRSSDRLSAEPEFTAGTHTFNMEKFMTLEQTASVAEILGLILVIASLIYLARQIGQTTAMMRVGASNERIQRDTDIVNSIVQSREVAEYWMKGATEFAGLDEVDKQRLVFLSAGRYYTGITCSVCTSKIWFQMQTGTN
jgi:hypothetical protein